MIQIVSMLVGVCITVVFFQLRHMTKVYSDNQIHKYANEKADIRFRILSRIIKSAYVKEATPAYVEDDISDDNYQHVKKCVSVKEYNTKIVRVTIAPYIDGVYSKLLLILFVTSVYFVPALLVSFYIGSLWALVFLAPYMFFGMFYFSMVSGMLNPITLVIRDGTYSINGGILPQGSSEFRDLSIGDKSRFIPINYVVSFTPNSINDTTRANGIGFQDKYGIRALAHGPTFLLRFSGNANFEDIVQQLNNEIKS